MGHQLDVPRSIGGRYVEAWQIYLKTLDEALKNIHEVIELCLEEQKEEIVEQLDTIQEFSYHVVSVEI